MNDTEYFIFARGWHSMRVQCTCNIDINRWSQQNRIEPTESWTFIYITTAIHTIQIKPTHINTIHTRTRLVTWVYVFILRVNLCRAVCICTCVCLCIPSWNQSTIKNTIKQCGLWKCVRHLSRRSSKEMLLSKKETDILIKCLHSLSRSSYSSNDFGQPSVAIWQFQQRKNVFSRWANRFFSSF